MALTQGQTYYVYVQRDVAIPITRCLFVYEGEADMGAMRQLRMSPISRPGMTPVPLMKIALEQPITA